VTKGRWSEDELRFFELNRQLVLFISEIIQIGTNELDGAEDVWRNLSVLVANLNDLILYYETTSAIYDFAGVQVGLAKYFDFSFPELVWVRFQGDLIRRVTSIVLLARKILVSLPAPKRFWLTKCGRHEDRACIKAPLGARFAGTSDIVVQGWPDLPAKDAVNFSSNPKHIVLQPGQQLFRVIDKTNNIYGSWWMLKMPKTRKVWRSDMAVLSMWNLDNYCIELALHEAVHAWHGVAASQQIPKTQCILKGGGEQLWIPVCAVKRLMQNPRVIHTVGF
jgi:hypothetical protein